MIPAAGPLRPVWILPPQGSHRATRIFHHSPKGFTLIELLIGLALLGLILGLAVGQVGKIFEREMKHSANKLASTIRYLYNKSASEGLTLRLVIDMDESKYWVESTSAEGFALTQEEREESKEKREKRKEKNGGAKEKSEEKKEDVKETKSKEAAFTQEGSALLKPVQMPKGVHFKDVYAEHQIGKLDSGQSYIYFFSQGYVERSVINLTDKADKVHYSLTINPISGEVTIAREYKEAEIEH